MSLAWEFHSVEFHVLASEVPVVWLWLANIDGLTDASPCLVHVFRGTGKLEIVHINDQHAVQLRMIEDTLPNIWENLFPSFFADA